jgi:hypothetical protein
VELAQKCDQTIYRVFGPEGKEMARISSVGTEDRTTKNAACLSRQNEPPGWQKSVARKEGEGPPRFLQHRAMNVK